MNHLLIPFILVVLQRFNLSIFPEQNVQPFMIMMMEQHKRRRNLLMMMQLKLLL